MKSDATDMQPVQWAGAPNIKRGVIIYTHRLSGTSIGFGVVGTLPHSSPFVQNREINETSESPQVLEHDIELAPDEYGGPVIDLNGRAIGITISLAGQYGHRCLMLRAEVIVPCLQCLTWILFAGLALIELCNLLQRNRQVSTTKVVMPVKPVAR